MVRIEVLADEHLFAALQEEAQRRSMTVEDLARSALDQFLASTGTQRKGYSFIGVGRSGQSNLSQTANEKLAEARRDEGWSLP